MMKRQAVFIVAFILAALALQARLPEIEPGDVNAKVNEIMKAHVSQKEMTPTLMKRALKKFLEEIDPSKTYLIQSDVANWLEPSDEKIDSLVDQYGQSDFSSFFQIHGTMAQAIERRNRIEAEVEGASLPDDVQPKEFKDLDWCASEECLRDRILRIRALQAEASENFDEEQRELAIQRIQKRRQKNEEDLLESDPILKQRFVLSKLLKAIAGSLDNHTAYFTPGEATQFMIGVQQRLFGIGAQLRDDLSGFTVVKIIDGGPAARADNLRAKDRIIAVDGEPVVGMEITDAVELIRGKEGDEVLLTVVRNLGSEEKKEEERLEVPIVRGEVVLTETRLESAIEPFGDGVIVYLRLYSFYQDPDSSSALDITRELNKLGAEHNIKGIVLDLRYNAGGMLSQAVAVTGLFISRGVVVSIKDDSGRVQHLRDLDGNVIWGGPLVTLTNRASASAAEIVAQTLQDYGRAIVVGDDHTYGKGTFQTFTLNSSRQGQVNPKGEYKVTRGTYYTVSGRSPQLHGVQADIIVPGALSEVEIGEQHADYPLEAGVLSPLFDDELLDVPEKQRKRVASLYRMNLQPRLSIFTDALDRLRSNSETRVDGNKHYQAFLEEIRKEEIDREELEQFEGVDFQLTEAYNVIKDLVVLTPAAA